MKNALLNSRIANQLTGATVTLIVVCLFSFISPERTIPLPIGDEPGGGKSITSDEAKQLIANFPKWKSTSGIKGGYLSKTAIDAMFTADPTATGIFWYMGSDAEGASFNLIVEPGISSKNVVNQTARTSIFVSETMCPTECGLIGK